MNYTYLKWMAENTPSQWCNDSAIPAQLDGALVQGGAIGCTSNPPLSFQALDADIGLYADELAGIKRGMTLDETALELIGAVVRPLSRRMLPMYEESGHTRGFIRTQVQPALSADADAMIKMGVKMSGWGKNVMVKIPGTKAGMTAIEELAARGIPTNPTVCIAVAQAVEAAKAYERGKKRALAGGITPAPCTPAVVMGRLSDWINLDAEKRGITADKDDLAWAVLAVIRNIFTEYKKEGFSAVLMPAAFRSAKQVVGIAGAPCCMTIALKVQKMLSDAFDSGEISCREGYNDEIPMEIIDRVGNTFPEFWNSYRPDGLTINEFDTYAPVCFTLDGFDKGWKQLYTIAEKYM